MKKILIMGLPGSGKTFLATALKKYLEENSNVNTMPLERMFHLELPPIAYTSKVDWFNADEIRKRFNDWDFSKEGRIRQSLRMAEFALKSSGDFVICDFVAPWLRCVTTSKPTGLSGWTPLTKAGLMTPTRRLFHQSSMTSG
jgi:adenylylsulfate kinase